ncbi:17967_t:CDS:2 [Entrophospora sp. SA101]|nr:3674_t:CDS:2 [Entrophospora sp. SA101]CAJ0926696.1 17967_t:CDS:2 [Entrophospora sp. SA101]
MEISTNNVDLLIWWKGNFGAVAPELTKVVARVLSIPTSSAAAERNCYTNVGEDIDDSDDDNNDDSDDTVDDSDDNVDNVDNSDIDSTKMNYL